MLNSQIPVRFVIPFANNAGAGFVHPVPIASQIGISDGAASLTDGFPPDTFIPVSAGGIPPDGKDFNGILLQATAWCRWIAAGGKIGYDTTFATGSAGYTNGSIIRSNIVPDDWWMSTVDNNVTDPDSVSSAGWEPVGIRTGTWDFDPTNNQTRSTWIKANGLSVGSASSGASGLASASALLVYRYLWNGFPQTQCPVVGGRGANADADFNNNKPISIFGGQGIGQIGIDTMGGGATSLLAGVPLISGNASTPGSVLGENLHALIANENGQHSHSYVDNGHSHLYWAVGNRPGQQAGITVVVPDSFTGVTSVSATGISINNSGLGDGHNTVQRSMAGIWWIKL